MEQWFLASEVWREGRQNPEMISSDFISRHIVILTFMTPCAAARHCQQNIMCLTRERYTFWGFSSLFWSLLSRKGLRSETPSSYLLSSLPKALSSQIFEPKIREIKIHLSESMRQRKNFSAELIENWTFFVRIYQNANFCTFLTSCLCSILVLFMWREGLVKGDRSSATESWGPYVQNSRSRIFSGLELKAAFASSSVLFLSSLTSCRLSLKFCICSTYLLRTSWLYTNIMSFLAASFRWGFLNWIYEFHYFNRFSTLFCMNFTSSSQLSQKDILKNLSLDCHERCFHCTPNIRAWRPSSCECMLSQINETSQ